MKRKKKVLTGILFVLIVCVFGTCMSISAASKSKIAFQTSYSNLRMQIGSRKTIYVVDENGTKIDASQLKWRSSNTSVAAINNGCIEAKNYGKTYIYVRLKDSPSNTLKFLLRVYRKKRAVTIKNIDENYVLPINKTKKLTPSVKGSYYKFHSSDQNVLKVSSSGIIRGINEGVATISYVTIGKDYYKTTIKVKVGQRITKIDTGVLENVLTLYVGEDYRMEPTVMPYSAANKKLGYACDNEEILSVDNNLNIKAMKEGTAKITLGALDGSGKKAVLKVIVLDPKTGTKLEDVVTEIVGHRGLPALAPENTIPSFELAGRSGLDAIECDVQVTKDGHLVIMHDDTMERMCGVNLKISDLTLEELYNYPIITGANIENYDKLYIPTLDEFIECCNKYMCTPVVEIKGVFDDDSLQKVYESISKSVKKPVVLSFYRYNLRWMRLKDPNVEVRNLVKIINENEIAFCRQMSMGISVKAANLTAEYVKRVQKQGIQLSVWGVKTAAEYEFFKSMKVNSISVDAMF